MLQRLLAILIPFMVRNRNQFRNRIGNQIWVSVSVRFRVRNGNLA